MGKMGFVGKKNKNKKFVKKKNPKPKSKGEPVLKFRKTKELIEKNIKRLREIKDSEVDEKKLKKYERLPKLDIKKVDFKIEQKRIANKEEKIKYGLKQSVTSEVLLTEEGGYLQPDEDEKSTQFKQTEIKSSVDLLSASKRFDLNLKDFGPYRMNYTRNGKFLLLGGRKGHVAAIDWISKKLLCEINVMESTYDVSWLHQETLFAVAQKKWVYIYDNQGVEIHCVKKLYNVVKLMFLPYHFLLATASSNGFISWLDVSIGEMVAQFHLTHNARAPCVAQHPGNAMIGIGEPTGTVSFWGPNSKKPAIIKLCHKTPISALAFEPKGMQFTTAGVDGLVKIWDARNLNGPLQHYRLRSAPNCISMSHKGMMALGLRNLVEVYQDSVRESMIEKQIYLRHKVMGTIGNMEFCPFEDILGIAHSTGFTSILVPGSGEPNFDALEVNPFQTKSQRREAEVKALLGKIPSDLITWDPAKLRKVDVPSLDEILEAKSQIANIKAPNVKFTPRKKMGKGADSAKTAMRKRIMKEEFRRNYVKEMKLLQDEQKVEEPDNKPDETSKSVLDRFIRKPRN